MGLLEPSKAAARWQRVAGALTDLPVGWPIVWIVIAFANLPAAASRRDGSGMLAAALLVSALSLESSFAVLSIASDLRYHLWAMVATATAVALLGRRRWRLPWVALLVLVIIAGIGARLLLPTPPQTYAGMLG